MPRLFVDCDYTLILWTDASSYENTIFVPTYGEFGGDKYRVNHELIESISEFMGQNPDYLLVVWSGGGVQYASRWANTCFPEGFFTIYPKYVDLAKEDDVCVDDILDLKVKGTLYTPEAFIEKYAPS